MSAPPGYDLTQIQQYTPEMMELFKSLFQYLGPDSFLSQLAQGDEGAFAEMEKPALQQFSGIQGNIASRFSGLGQGARGSSGFQNTLNQAGSDFAQQLQANRTNVRQNALQELMNFSNQLLNQKPYEQKLTEKQAPWWQSFLESAAGSAAKAASQWATGG